MADLQPFTKTKCAVAKTKVRQHDHDSRWIHVYLYRLSSVSGVFEYQPCNAEAMMEIIGLLCHAIRRWPNSHRDRAKLVIGRREMAVSIVAWASCQKQSTGNPLPWLRVIAKKPLIQSEATINKVHPNNRS